jgi:SAM-dependent methyltransferase
MSQRDEDRIDQAYVDWQTGVRFTQYSQGDQPLATGAATSLDELFAADGARFVRLAFHTFLGREPDDEELSHHLELLGRGVGKTTLAARLRYAPEASNRPQTLHLQKAQWLDKLSQLPLLGYAVRLLSAVAGSPGAKASLLSQHQSLHELRQTVEQLRSVDRHTIHDLVQAEEQHKLDLRQTGLLIDELRQEIKSLRDRQQELDDSLQSAQPGDGSARQESQGTPVDEGFYLAFENHFRGSEDVIRERLTYYLPVLADKLPAYEHSQVIDIGCGRGEWMGLLRDRGYSVTGIDLNERNVAHCRDKGLNAVLADGIQWLRQTESKSVQLISSFHVIEHLSLPQLNSLLIEALRCLEPGGMIILETPNPENLVTAAHRFYTDPSHKNPLPPDLMEFFLKYQGFIDVEIHRLHPAAGSENIGNDPAADKLNQLLFGPQDYAVIARRP